MWRVLSLMSKIVWTFWLVSPAAWGVCLVMGNAALAVEAAEQISVAALTNRQQVEIEQLYPGSNGSDASLQLAQVTRVSELSDVRPSDWAFTALQRLVEEYECIEGFPNLTYRGDQALTRHQFAAGLNACLNTLILLIADSGVAEDLDVIRRLQTEFQSELAALSGRIDGLEANVAELEANQFSTTTKLRGQVDAHLITPFDSAFEGETTTFEYRARLNFDTSFMGEDRLRVRLQTGTNNDAASGFPNGLSKTRGGDNDVTLGDVYYSFPIGDRIDIIIGANGVSTNQFVTSTIVPFDDANVGDTGSPTFYDFEMDGDTGVGISFVLTDNLVIDTGYSVEVGAAGDPDSQGIFGGGGQSYIAQISYLSDGLIDTALTFLHGNPDADEAPTNTFAGLFNLDFDHFQIGGYGAFHSQEDSDQESYSWGVGVIFPDLFFNGDTLGAYVGQAPSYTENEPLYFEGFYDIQINPFLTITPAILYAEKNNLNGDFDNTSSSVYGVIRASFRF